MTPTPPKKGHPQTNPNSLRNLSLRWKNYRKEIRRKWRRHANQLGNLARWWKPGQRSPNPAGGALAPGAQRTEAGRQGLVQAPQVWAEARRQAKRDVEERRAQEAPQDARAMQSTEWTPAPEAPHPSDWGAARYYARHPDQAPGAPDKYDWAAQRVAARHSNIVAGHHGRRVAGPRWHRPPRGLRHETEESED